MEREKKENKKTNNFQKEIENEHEEREIKK